MKEYFLNTVLGTLCLQIKNGAVRRMGFVENMAGEELDLREILHGIAFGTRICLRPGGTTFQRLVWTEIQKIPPGETCTYGHLAKRMGKPRASRAAGRAVGANPVVMLLPCHRVLPAQGGVGGFRWGSWRKRQLLAWEAKGEDALAMMCGLPQSVFQCWLDFPPSWSAPG